MRRARWSEVGRLARHPLSLLLLAAVAVRVIALVGYQPLWGVYSDSHQYAASASSLASTFASDLPIRPQGYPVMLAGLEVVWSSLTLVAIVQHALGLAATVLLYLTMRRLGAPLWAALGAAAVIALFPDVVFFEHALLSESPFLFLTTAATYAAVRGIDESDADPHLGRWLAWLAAAGALFAFAAMFRAVGQVLFPLVPLVAVVAVRGAFRRRLAAALAAAVPAVALVLAYSAAMSSAGGYPGLADGQGWALYTRTAPIADCTRFDPPPGTERLCESSPPDSRPGPDYYAWHPDSHARALFVGPPQYDDQVGAFGREVLENQPLDYLKLVLTDVWRYVDFDAGLDRTDNGSPISLYRFGGESSGVITDDPLADFYGPYRYEINGLGRTLGDVQQVVRVHGVLILAAAILALVGLLLGPRKIRIGIALVGGPAFLLLLAPVALGVFNSRYAVPAEPALVASGLLGAWAITRRQPVRAAARLARRRRAVSGAH